MTRQMLSDDVMIRIARKLSIEQRFICKHVSPWVNNVMEYSGTEIGYMSIFKTVFLLASHGHESPVIQKWAEKMLLQLEPNLPIGFHDVQLVLLFNQSIKRTLSDSALSYWKMNKQLDCDIFPFTAVAFNNDELVQSLDKETICRLSINQGNPRYLKYFDGFSVEDLKNGFVQVLQKRNITLVHSFMKIFGDKLKTLPQDAIKECWHTALWLDLETFKIIDYMANYPKISDERVLGSKLQEMSPAVFGHLKTRLTFRILLPIASYFPKTNGWDVYCWLYSKLPKSFPTNLHAVCQLVHGLLEQANIEALRWIIERYNLRSAIMQVCVIKTSIGHMLKSNMERHQIQECCMLMYGQTLEQVCSDFASLFGSIEWNYHKILERLPTSNNFWLLEYLHATKQISPESLVHVNESGRYKLTTYAILHKSLNIFEWLVEKGYPYTWTVLGAAVLSMDLHTIKAIYYRYFTTSQKDVPVMLLAATRGNVDIIHFLYQCGYVVDAKSMLIETIECCSITTAHYVFKMGNFSEDIHSSYRFFNGALYRVNAKVGRFAESFANWFERQVLPIFENTDYHYALSVSLAQLRDGTLKGKCTNGRLSCMAAIAKVYDPSALTTDKNYASKLAKKLRMENNWISEIIGPEATQAIKQWHSE
uniref:Ankyrin repeat protein n=1 Tax=Clandestinovirus TaxID=2831644 RepID=A0A8F8KQT2_9VIRU|nr:ankyrin repeat protein [Clandestinovirus]